MEHGIQSLSFKLEQELDNAHKQLRILEKYSFDEFYGEEEKFFPKEFEWSKFEYYLQLIYRLLCFSFEVGGFPLTRQEFMNGWKIYKDNLTKTEIVHEVDVLNSEPLGYLGEYIAAFKLIAFGNRSPVQDYHKDLLERLLKSTAVLLRKRNIVPQKEHDIQKVMRDYLSAAFSDYVKSPQISGFIKNFKPDGGIKSIHSAIEYKFVSSESELKVAISGILEDAAGYSGSLDWQYFYSVIYMTEPFEAEPRLKEELARVNTSKWQMIPVIGGNANSKT